ncbi:MAG TPA: TRZ/ATZ family protein [Clostridiales bacterium]|nr:TRZ/ATZ family protein [Clostridiales bacterium]
MRGNPLWLPHFKIGSVVVSEIKKINTKDLKEQAGKLKIGDKILLTGWMYTARDAAHKRIDTLLNDGGELPFEIENAVIYYAGPTPAPAGKPIGSCGPTTSGRMDKFAPRLLDLGLGAMIGKGERSLAVIDAVERNKALYLCAIGGAGALAANCIKSCEVIAFEDLGCESVKKLYVEDFPLVVANDTFGGDIFSSGKEEYSVKK